MMLRNTVAKWKTLGKFFFFFFFALVGCENNEDKAGVYQRVDEFLSPKRTFDSLTVSFWEEDSDNYLALESFLGYYFDHLDNSFSLDDDLTVYLEGRRSERDYFMYSKNKERNKVWSSACGVYEILSREQIERLDSLEENVKMENRTNPPKGQRRISMFTWKGKKQKRLLLRKRFEYFLTSPNSFEIYNFFAKEVFVHGCKKHLLVTF